MQVAFDDHLFTFPYASEDVDHAVPLRTGLHGAAKVAAGRFLDEDVALVADQEYRGGRHMQGRGWWQFDQRRGEHAALQPAVGVGHFAAHADGAGSRIDEIADMTDNPSEAFVRVLLDLQADFFPGLERCQVSFAGVELEPQAGRVGDDEQRVAAHFRIGECGRPGDAWLRETVRWAWKIKLLPHLDTEIKQRLREAAEEEAIRVFARNLRDLLLAAPAGARATLGLDPGLRTGVKVAVVDATGKLVETATLYPHPPRNQWQDSLRRLAELCARHHVELISIGNGTASRETDRLATELLQRCPELRLQKRVVSEAGASVYSASELAAREFPEVDVSLRGAVSIARRLQDPLAELVKIEPKAIGVGQYQHDVSQTRLARSLDAVVEDCVNAVGVDVNTASAPLLARVAGLNATLARNIVEFRDANGPFRRREQLLKVARLGDKTFEQAAGFLRIVNGDNPLDRSAVHPEAYPVIERILAASGRGLHEVLGNAAFLKTLDAARFTDTRFGLPTVRDILAELEKPGRDPRPDFRAVTFREGVEKLSDLQAGMVLEGVVTNVANFGAFVDIGVHQDGLVHVSALAERFVKDPREVVKAGQIVRVRVLEVDLQRQRIALSMRLNEPAQAVEAARPAAAAAARPVRERGSRAPDQSPPRPGALAEAFARARDKG